MSKILKERSKRVKNKKRKLGGSENNMTNNADDNEDIGNLVNKLKKKIYSS